MCVHEVWGSTLGIIVRVQGLLKDTYNPHPRLLHKDRSCWKCAGFEDHLSRLSDIQKVRSADSPLALYYSIGI